MALPDELTFEDGAYTSRDLENAVDAASQGHTTWLVSGYGKRLAKIAPADEAPDDELGRLLAAKRLETEPVWAASQVSHEMSPAFRDLLLQSVARQTEEIHRALGLETSEDGGPVPAPLPFAVSADRETAAWRDGYETAADAGSTPAPGPVLASVPDRCLFPGQVQGLIRQDPLGPPWYGKLDEITARVAAGELTLISRDLLIQVLGNAGLIDPDDGNGLRTGDLVWDALHAPPPADPPTGRNLGRYDLALKYAPGGLLTGQVVSDALSLAGVPVSEETAGNWAYPQRLDAYDWAIREHLAASDNNVTRVPRPAFISVRTPCPECGQTGTCKKDCRYWEVW